MQHSEDPVGALRERLRLYPPDRYPVQHATAQFHLGVVLADRGDLPGAEAALAAAAGGFDRRALPAEHGKAMNALGSVLRMAGRPHEAVQVLLHAEAAFQAADLPAERGAACFNLGLVRREADDLPAALAALEQARDLFDEANAPVHAAAASRELGMARFAAGDLDGAREALEDGVAGATRGADHAGAGAAANVLGLVELAAGHPAVAADWFSSAAAEHPRTLRPADHAMAKANLAIAHERAGDVRRARVAARQAVGVPAAPPPVRSQAEGVVERLGEDPDDVMAVLAEEQPDIRFGLVRDELARWLDAGEGARRAEAGAWIDGHLARPAVAVEVAVVWLGGLLELPPDDMETIMRSVVEALRDRDEAAQERFRSEIARASARFHVPQLVRMRDTFNRVAVEVGAEPSWR